MLPVVRTLDSFPAFYGTQRFNTELTRAVHLFLSRTWRIQSTSPRHTCTRSILILSTHLGLPFLLSLWLSHQQPIRVPFLPHSSYMPRPSHSRLYYSNDTWWRMQIMNLLVMHVYIYIALIVITFWSTFVTLPSVGLQDYICWWNEIMVCKT
jgi:hypothetical protein